MWERVRRLAPAVVLAGVASGLVCSPAGASDYRLGPLVRLSGASPFHDGCNGAGSHATGAAGEPTLAVDPGDALKLVAAWKQDVDSADSTTDEVAFSTNGGRTWTHGPLPRSGACNGGDPQYTHLTDPWASFAPSGVVWVSTLPYTNANPGAVAVHRSSDGGRSFGPPAYVDRDQNATDFDDKESIVADPHDPSRAYVTWVKQQVPTAPLPGVPLVSVTEFARTDDGGATWSSRQIATTMAPNAFAGGIVTALPAGRLLLTYPQITPAAPLDCVADQECRGTVTVFAVRSSDGGRTWSAPTLAARYTRGPVDDPEGHEIKASADQYSLAVDPSGTVYLAAHDEREAPRSHLVVTRSTDGGLTWAPLADADAASPAHGPKLQPIIAAGAGALGVLYFDFRDDVAHGDGHADFSWWFDHSEDGGRTWHEQRVTGPSDLHAAPGPPEAFDHFIGDYFGLQPVGRDFVAALTLARPLAGDAPTSIFAVRLAAPPALAHLRVTPRRVRLTRRPLALHVSFVASTAAQVRFTVTRRGVRLPGHVTRVAAPGLNRLVLRGRLRGKVIGPGSYVLVATPKGGAPAHARFAVTRAATARRR